MKICEECGGYRPQGFVMNFTIWGACQNCGWQPAAEISPEIIRGSMADIYHQEIPECMQEPDK